jgi:hypothetical protein
MRSLFSGEARAKMLQAGATCSSKRQSIAEQTRTGGKSHARTHMCVRACKCQVCCCGNSDALRTGPKAQGGMTGQHSRCHAQDLCMCRQGVCMYAATWPAALCPL